MVSWAIIIPWLRWNVFPTKTELQLKFLLWIHLERSSKDDVSVRLKQLHLWSLCSFTKSYLVFIGDIWKQTIFSETNKKLRYPYQAPIWVTWLKLVFGPLASHYCQHRCYLSEAFGWLSSSISTITALGGGTWVEPCLLPLTFESGKVWGFNSNTNIL